MNHVTAFVLAGGKSSRMGADKAFLDFQGATLLTRALQLAGSVAPVVGIVGSRDKFAAYGAVVEDVYPARGPLGGIHAALSATKTELNLVLAVDTPFLTTATLEYLLAEAAAGAALVTVPRVGGRFHPLCAVYRREFASRAERALQAGHNKIDPLFAPAETRIIEEEELKCIGVTAAAFDNLNTPEEWERARRPAASQ
jgi:molybdopterin-guanine dinucleotide biosynthesis protein A